MIKFLVLYFALLASVLMFNYGAHKNDDDE